MSSVTVSLGIDFNESTQPAKFELKTNENSYSLSIKAPIGEIIQPVFFSEEEFIAAQSEYINYYADFNYLIWLKFLSAVFFFSY